MKKTFWHTSLFFICCFLLLALTSGGAAADIRRCGDMLDAELKNGQVTSANSISQSRPRGLPSYCRVIATLSPMPKSRIVIELWLPDQWNGKLYAVGNHGYGGDFDHTSMARALKRNYAVVMTDTGHTGEVPPGGLFATETADFVDDNGPATEDFAWRATHEMSIAAKSLIQSKYDEPARYAYFDGCGGGGSQVVNTAERFPTDFDGLMIGSASIDGTRMMARALWSYQSGNLGSNKRMTPAKLALAQQSAITSCDKNDGLEDGLINDPSQCHWEPKSLQCSGVDNASCLTSSEVTAINKMYAPLIDPDTGEVLAPGFPRGSELSWISHNGHMGHLLPITKDFFRRFVLKDMSFDDWDNADVVKLLKMSEANESRAFIRNSHNPDLSDFHATGGKIIHYHGWNDPVMLLPMGYYNKVVKNFPGENKLENVRDFYRLFMAPGLNHCQGGMGPINFGGIHQRPSPKTDADHDLLEALDRWVDKGIAPDQVIATSNTRPQRQVPICSYPGVAHYVGGDVNSAESFTCKLPE